ASWYSWSHTPWISCTNRFRSSPGSVVSGVGTRRSPRSRTTWPIAVSRSWSPAMRIAEGPMSTPRRPPPRPSGTPMIWIAAISPLDRDGDAFVAGADDRRHHVRRGVDDLEELGHLVALVDHVVRQQQPALAQLGQR